MTSADAIRSAVSAVTDPELRRPIGDLDMVRDISLDGTRAHVAIVLTIVGCPAAARIEWTCGRPRHPSPASTRSTSRWAS